MRRTHLWGYDHPRQQSIPLLALAAGAAAWEGVSRALVGQQSDRSGHFLLSASLWLLGLPVSGWLKAGTASSMGKSRVTVESGPGEHMLHALKLSQREQPRESSGCCQLSPRRDERSHQLELGDPGRRTRPCRPGCWHVWLQDLCNP